MNSANFDGAILMVNLYAQMHVSVARSTFCSLNFSPCTGTVQHWGHLKNNFYNMIILLLFETQHDAVYHRGQICIFTKNNINTPFATQLLTDWHGDRWPIPPINVDSNLKFHPKHHSTAHVQLVAYTPLFYSHFIHLTCINNWSCLGGPVYLVTFLCFGSSLALRALPPMASCKWKYGPDCNTKIHTISIFR